MEFFEEFTQFIAKKDNINIINKNILDFDTDKKYDVVSLFGIIQYFSTEESIKIYKNCYKYLKPNGKIIIKNQFGVSEDVTVFGYSDFRLPITNFLIFLPISLPTSLFHISIFASSDDCLFNKPTNS